MCLQRDNKLDVLAFFRLGCDLGVRQKDLVNITWKDIDCPWINHFVKSEVDDSKSYLISGVFSSDTAQTIVDGCDKKINVLFPNKTFYYVNQIIESCGDIKFSGHDMRRMSLVLDLIGKYDGLISL